MTDSDPRVLGIFRVDKFTRVDLHALTESIRKEKFVAGDCVWVLLRSSIVLVYLELLAAAYSCRHACAHTEGRSLLQPLQLLQQRCNCCLNSACNSAAAAVSTVFQCC